MRKCWKVVFFKSTSLFLSFTMSRWYPEHPRSPATRFIGLLDLNRREFADAHTSLYTFPKFHNPVLEQKNPNPLITLIALICTCSNSAMSF